MSEWAPKRFWSDVTIEHQAAGFTIKLDGRAVKTPAKAALVVPTRALAEAIAAEWRQVDEKIDPSKMPFTRSANAAIDKVSHQFDEVVELLAAYGGSDLLCYRAESPMELVERQARLWNPLLDWAARTHSARLEVAEGVMPVHQDTTALQALRAPIEQANPFELTALHDLIALSGSLVIALAVIGGRLSHQEAWAVSRLDENWQEEQWGVDEEASQAAEIKQQAFAHAAFFYDAAQNDARG